MLRASLTLCPALTALILIVPGCGESSDAQTSGDSGSGLTNTNPSEEGEAGEASEDEDEAEASDACSTIEIRTNIITLPMAYVVYKAFDKLWCVQVSNKTTSNCGRV